MWIFKEEGLDKLKNKTTTKSASTSIFKMKNREKNLHTWERWINQIPYLKRVFSKEKKKNTHLWFGIWYIQISQRCNLFFSFENTHLRCGIWFIHFSQVCKFFYLFLFLKILVNANFASSFLAYPKILPKIHVLVMNRLYLSIQRR